MRILFVCTGNTCRSPMAEAMLRQMARERNVQLEVKSAGVAAVPGEPMSGHTAAVLRDHGIVDEITSSPLRPELVEWADLILTLTSAHKQRVVQIFPEAVDKVAVLKEFIEDEEKVAAAEQKVARLITETELDRALGLPVEDKERQIAVLVKELPVYDIMDPFGGPREAYDVAAAEIRSAIDKLLGKLERDQ